MVRPEHLTMIQTVIARLANNSFVVKGWSVTLTAALLGFAAADNDASFAWIAFGAATVFAVLDARYLALEGKYIDLYNAARVSTDDDWNLTPERPKAADVIKALLSWSVGLVHGVAMVAALAVAI